MKISEYTELMAPSDADVLPIVHLGTTYKISFATIRADIVASVPPGTGGGGPVDGLPDTGHPGLVVRTTTDVTVARQLAPPAAGFTIGNPDGVAGNPTFNLADDLAALEALTGGGYSKRIGVDSWALVSLIPAADVDLPGGFSGFANPSAVVGLAAVNGAATTAMRSDAAPALSQAIAPTWSAVHTFTLAPKFSAMTAGSVLFAGTAGLLSQDAANLFYNDATNSFGIGTNAPGQQLHVAGTIRTNGALEVLPGSGAANLFLLNAATGLQAATDKVITPQALNAIRSTTYTAGLVGWNISAAGDAEFNNVVARGEFRASTFKYDEITATAGTFGVFYSASTLYSDCATPATTGSAFNFTAKNTDQGARLFNDGDVIRMRAFVSTSGVIIGDAWATITAHSSAAATTTYTATLNAGSTSTTFRAGTAVVDYGPTATGFITLSADGQVGPTPNITLAKSTATPWSGNTLVARLGNLNGAFGYSSTIYGLGVGQYGTAGESWIVIATDPGDATKSGVRLGNNTTTRVHLKIDGSGYLANSNISWSTTGDLTVAGNATIAGWSISAARIQTANVFIDSTGQYISLGAVPPTSYGNNVGVFLEGANNGRFSIYYNASNYFQWDGSKLLIKAANFTLDASGNLTATSATLSGAITATSGTIAGNVTVTGSLTAGGGVVVLDSNGVCAIATGAYSDARAFVIRDASSNIVSSFSGYVDSSDNIARLKAFTHGVGNSQVLIESDAISSQLSTIRLLARRGGTENARIDLEGNTAIVSTIIQSSTIQSVGPGYVQITGNLYASGNVGIGTTGPTSRFSIAAAGNSRILDLSASSTGTGYQYAQWTTSGAHMLWGVESSTAGGIFSGSTAYGSIWGTNNATAIHFSPNNVVAMTLINGGNVGIGTTAPSVPLHVVGLVRFSSYGAGTLVTDTSGNVTASSDERLKFVDGVFMRGLTELREAGRPVYYRWRPGFGTDDTETRYVGWTTQSLEAAIPEAVMRGNPYNNLWDRAVHATMHNAILDLDTRADNLQSQITSLQLRVDDLERQVAELIANQPGPPN
jgi:hypothetical protein